MRDTEYIESKGLHAGVAHVIRKQITGSMVDTGDISNSVQLYTAHAL